MVIGTPVVLNLIPGGVTKVVHVNQVNDNIEIQFQIMNGSQPYNVTEGVSCTIRGTKGDSYGYTAEAATTVGSNVVTVTLTEQLTAVAGGCNVFELVFVGAENSMKVSTENFILAVERAALGEDTVISDSDLAYAAQVLDQLQSVGAVNAQVQQNKANIAAEVTRATAAEQTLQQNINSEASARQSADNTLQSNINVEASARATQDNVLQAEIDQLVAPSGSAPSAAEVTNARIGADGTTYDTLGNAIRGQVTDVKSQIDLALQYRRTLTSSDDLDAIADSGHYFISGTDYPAHAPDAEINNCRLLVIKSNSANVHTGEIQIIVTKTEFFVRHSYKNSGGFSPWRNLEIGNNVVQNRGSLTGSDNLNSLLLPGIYYVADGVTPQNGPDTVNAYRLLSLKSSTPTNHFAELQLTILDTGDVVARVCRNDQGTNWTEWRSLAFDDDLDNLLDLLTKRTIYELNTSNLLYSCGGIDSNGRSYNLTTRIRYRNTDGLGAIPVLAGSTITANEGYKFNIALYSTYQSNDDFVKIGYRTMSADPYTVTQDCFIRIGIGTVNDDELWASDSEGLKTYTEAGILAKSGLTLDLKSGSIKEKVANIEDKISNSSYATYYVHTLEDDLPLNAVDYHALWDDMVDAGEVTRTLLDNIDDDDDLPVYLYTIRHDMDHINPNYSKIPWNGTNELYSRPKILLTSGIHGNERTTPVAVWDFVSSLFRNVEYRGILNAFDWYVIPLVNPWGFSHTAILTSTGVVDKGSGYTRTTKANYTVVDNDSTYHQGIRCNSDGIDVNRDFSAFNTQEAQVVRDAIAELTSDGRDFAFAIDAHQAANGSYVNVIGCFLSLQYGASADAKNFIYGKWMQAGALTEKLMADYADVEEIQSVYPWEGTNVLTARNYIADYADYSMCFEGGQTCIYYSGSSIWSNPICRALINTQYHYFLRALTKNWM